MENPNRIVLPHGGYSNLIVYDKSDVIYQGTVVFCRRFLTAYKDRTVDQMVQAARSCKQNIAEGSVASGTSKETEIKLTNVAKAYLIELLEDYRDYLKKNSFVEWPIDGEKKQLMRKYAIKYAKWKQWAHFFESRDSETVVNLMLVQIIQAKYLLDHLLLAQEREFIKQGGVRERMYAARMEARGIGWDKVLYSRIAAANACQELFRRGTEMKSAIDRIVNNLQKRKNWHLH